MSGGFLTPKAISNRIKAKGLQKLRWYCQMCQKQCRDENGFKCHSQSEAHLRNMAIYSQNPHKFKEKFSLEFERSFLTDLGRRHHTNQVKANSFYSEYITDKEHLHMNATRWTSLTEFVKDCGRRALLKVEEKDDGFYITWIDRSMGGVETEEQRQERREKTVADDAERDRERAEAQLRAAKSAGMSAEEVRASDLLRGQDDSPLEFAFVAPEPVAASPAAAKRAVVSAFGEEEDVAPLSSEPKRAKPKSALEEIKEREEELRKRQSRASAAPPAQPVPRGWLALHIDVKVRNRELGNGDYYGKKGRVVAVHNQATVADVEMRDSGDVLRVAMEQLETVLPQPGGTVLVVLGAHRGHTATLERLNVDQFSATVRVHPNGATVTLPYEHVCKLNKD